MTSQDMPIFDPRAQEVIDALKDDLANVYQQRDAALDLLDILLREDADLGAERLSSDGRNAFNVRDLCFTIFQMAKGVHAQSGEATTWTDDALPVVDAGIRKMRSLITGPIPQPEGSDVWTPVFWVNSSDGEGSTVSTVTPAASGKKLPF